MKTFYRQNNIGQAKYTISFHDGVQTYRDGSPFFAIAIFHNRVKLQRFVKKLLSEGYSER